MKYYVYKYVHQGDVIYIGKTDDVARRVNEHASGQGLEEKFLPYLEGVDIYFHECGNEVEMSALERLLINQYKPILNIVDVQPGASTIVIDMDWVYYDALPDTHDSVVEREIAMCCRNIQSNVTRMSTYDKECQALRQKMNTLLPFYKYLDKHADEFMKHPCAYFVINPAILPNEQTVWIGNKQVPCWCDDIAIRGNDTLVQWSGELLQQLFAVVHNDDWVQISMNEIGEKRCQLILKRQANLRRRNTELNAKKDALAKKLSHCVDN